MPLGEDHPSRAFLFYWLYDVLINFSDSSLFPQTRSSKPSPQATERCECLWWAVGIVAGTQQEPQTCTPNMSAHTWAAAEDILPRAGFKRTQYFSLGRKWREHGGWGGGWTHTILLSTFTKYWNYICKIASSPGKIHTWNRNLNIC